MIKLIYFVAGWAIGILVLNFSIFDALSKFVKDENSMAVFAIITVVVYTIVLGTIVCWKDKK